LLLWIESKLLKIFSNVATVLASEYDLKTPHLEARRCCILGQAVPKQLNELSWFLEVGLPLARYLLEWGLDSGSQK